MDDSIVYIVLAVFVLGAVVAVRIIQGRRSMSRARSAWCREHDVPDIPFDYKAAAREVMAGTRPDTPCDGQWWVATGIEQVGLSSLTRLLDEEALPNEDAVLETVAVMFADHSGPAIARPHLAESRFVGV